MRHEIGFYLNGKFIQLGLDVAFLNLSQFLREQKALVGTKIVCSEGDCGACSVLLADNRSLRPSFKTINSCIFPVFLADNCHLVTIEGLEDKALHPIQECMVDFQGAQCGFCSPGICISLASLFEQKNEITEKNVKNALTGNLCRCTGYRPIIDAALAAQNIQAESLTKRYLKKKHRAELSQFCQKPLTIFSGDKTLFAPNRLKQALEIKNKNPLSKVIGSGTDIGVGLNKGHLKTSTFISLQQIPQLYQIQKMKGHVVVGAKVSLAQIENELKTDFRELSRLIKLFASPQIKNVATLVGNVANGSPISDTAPYLIAVGAKVMAQSIKGKREIPVDQFYLGYKKLDLRPNEIVVGLKLPYLKKNQHVLFYKVSTRKDLDIATVNAAFMFEQDENKKITNVKLVYGGMGPTVMRAKNCEGLFLGQILNKELIKKGQSILLEELSPLSDLRASKEYRMKVAQNLLLKSYLELY